MKKFFSIAAITLAALTTGCTSDDDNGHPSDPGRQPITFTRPYINNAVRQRGALTEADISEFRVWGFAGQPDSYIFRNNGVSGEGEIWSVDAPARYWDSTRDYYFSAIAPVSDCVDFSPVTSRSTGKTFDGGGRLSFDCAAAQGREDLVYAFSRVRPDNRTNAMPVSLTFNHLLSRIVFRFTNSITPGTSVAIRDLSVSNIPATGTIDLTLGGAASWESAGSATISGIDPDAHAVYGENCESAAIFIVPSNRACQLSFTIELRDSSEQTKNYHHSVTLNPVDYQQGNSYRFTASLTPENISTTGNSTIEFRAENVNEWNPTD